MCVPSRKMVFNRMKKITHASRKRGQFTDIFSGPPEKANRTSSKFVRLRQAEGEVGDALRVVQLRLEPKPQRSQRSTDGIQAIINLIPLPRFLGVAKAFLRPKQECERAEC
jgi:hypothetical protein